jgi:hypothetical protein
MGGRLAGGLCRGRYGGDDRRRVVAEQVLFPLVEPLRGIGRGERGVGGELLAKRVIAGEGGVSALLLRLLAEQDLQRHHLLDFFWRHQRSFRNVTWCA